MQPTSIPIHCNESIYSIPNAWTSRSSPYDLSIALPHNASQQVSAKRLHLPILHGLSLTWTKKDKTFKAQEWYKKPFDMSVQSIQMFCLGGLVYVDQQTTAKTASERIADESRSKLLSKGVQPFRVINMTTHTIKIDDNIQNVILIKQGTPALRPKGGHPVKHWTHNAQSDTARTIERSIMDARQDKSTPKAIKNKIHRATGHVPSTSSAARSTDRYVVDHIVCHVNTKNGLRCLIVWYGYNAAEDTAKQIENISEHFMRFLSLSKCQPRKDRPPHQSQ